MSKQKSWVCVIKICVRAAVQWLLNNAAELYQIVKQRREQERASKRACVRAPVCVWGGGVSVWVGGCVLVHVSYHQVPPSGGTIDWKLERHRMHNTGVVSVCVSQRAGACHIVHIPQTFTRPKTGITEVCQTENRMSIAVYLVAGRAGAPPPSQASPASPAAYSPRGLARGSPATQPATLRPRGPPLARCVQPWRHLCGSCTPARPAPTASASPLRGPRRRRCRHCGGRGPLGRRPLAGAGGWAGRRRRRRHRLMADMRLFLMGT